jgi:hypothetical protein
MFGSHSRLIVSVAIRPNRAGGPRSRHHFVYFFLRPSPSFLSFNPNPNSFCVLFPICATPLFIALCQHEAPSRHCISFTLMWPAFSCPGRISSFLSAHRHRDSHGHGHSYPSVHDVFVFLLVYFSDFHKIANAAAPVRMRHVSRLFSAQPIASDLRSGPNLL